MQNVKFAALASSLALSLFANPVLAREAKPAFMPAGDVADAPRGFTEMCARDALLCRSGVATAQEVTPVMPSEPDGYASVMVVRAFAQMRSCSARPKLGVFSWMGVRSGIAAMIEQPSNHFGAVWGDKDISANCDLAASSRLGFALGARQPVATAAWPATASAIAPPASAALPMATAAVATDDAGRMAMLRTVNSGVNRGVRQRSDLAVVGEEDRWQRPGGGKNASGDCEDLAIEKRMRLIEAGFDARRLFYAVAYRSGFGLHVLLIARLDDGDYVLDSLAPHITRWDAVGYSWLRLQSPEDPMRWTRIDHGGVKVVARNGAPAVLS